MTNDCPVMIHNVDQEMVNFISENKDLFNNRIITFDDALYSQFYYMKQLLKILPNNDFYMFVSTAIVSPGGEAQIINIKAPKAHKNFRDSYDTRPYCTFEQLRLLDELGVNIGLHTHTHPKFKITDITTNLKKYTKKLKTEIRTSIYIHKLEQLGKVMGLTAMAYPYNYNAPLMFHMYNTKSTITKSFGKEREPIENIIF